MTSNPVSTDQSAKANRLKTAMRSGGAVNRKVMASRYGISTRTFQRWCEKAELKLPAGLLTPLQVKKIEAALGEWNG